MITTGMNRFAGTALSGLAHLNQSIDDILSTPIGSRVMLRDYGSRLPDLIDTPLNAAGKMAIYQATADALRRWEPRFVLQRVSVVAGSSIGSVLLDLVGIYQNKPISLQIVL